MLIRLTLCQSFYTFVNQMKIGLFCGSFNPVHSGHMIIANYMVEFTDLDQVWMVVSPHNPLKPAVELINDYQRLKLVQLAIDGHKKIKASDVEFALPKPSYTLNTLNYLAENYKQHTFVLIIGSDNLDLFDKWKDHDKILSNYELYVYPRLNSTVNKYTQNKNVKIIDAPVVEISSTFIRNSIKQKKDVRHFLPLRVFEYVDDLGLYEK